MNGLNVQISSCTARLNFPPNEKFWRSSLQLVEAYSNSNGRTH